LSKGIGSSVVLLIGGGLADLTTLQFLPFLIGQKHYLNIHLEKLEIVLEQLILMIFTLTFRLRDQALPTNDN
jgi:hypothetical protein